LWRRLNLIPRQNTNPKGDCSRAPRGPLADVAGEACKKVGFMSRYFFDIQWHDTEQADYKGVVLNSDCDALNHAWQFIRHLRRTGDFERTDLLMVIRDDAMRPLYSLPFLPH